MQIKQARFFKSAVLPEDWPVELYPHVALVGRSNVGKSSLINCIAGNRKLAHTSNVPGKTRLLNFYLLNESFFLTDLPGYGYSRVSMDEKGKWSEMIERYLKNSSMLRLVIQLIDIRHKPTPEDIQMLEWTRHFGFESLIVATKADKLSRSAVYSALCDIRNTLGFIDTSRIIPFSSVTGQGKDELAIALMAALDLK